MSDAIGAMRERPVIQVADESADAEGQPVKTWATFDTIWARCEFLTGRELEAMQKINAEISLKVTTRYRTDILVTMRMFWRSAFWNINAIMPTEDKFYMALLASRVD
jgi:SPP1 family predicted phage head-tail adaptor